MKKTALSGSKNKKNRFFLKTSLEKSPFQVAEMAIFHFIRVQFFYTDNSLELCSRKMIDYEKVFVYSFDFSSVALFV